MSDPLSVTPACVQFLLLHSLGCGASLLARAHCVSVRLLTAAMQPASSSVTHQTAGPSCPQCRLAPTVPIYACLLPAPPPLLTGQRGKAALSVGSHCVGLCLPAVRFFLCHSQGCGAGLPSCRLAPTVLV